MPNFILDDAKLSLGAKTVYSKFLSYAWHNNYVLPGQDTLAEAIGVTQGRVSQFIKELKAAGLIEINRRG